MSVPDGFVVLKNLVYFGFKGVTLYADRIKISKELCDKLGKPAYVELAYNAKEKLLLIAGATEASSDAYKLRASAVGKKVGIQSYFITRNHEFKPAKVFPIEASEKGIILNVELKEAP